VEKLLIVAEKIYWHCGKIKNDPLANCWLTPAATAQQNTAHKTPIN